jgi:hypothetical protein
MPRLKSIITNIQKMDAMETRMRTAKAQHLAKTIMDDLEALLSTSNSYEQPGAGIAEGLKENADKITSFSDLHDYMDANTLGESEEVWEELTDDIGPKGDEVKVQNEAQTIVDEWIKQGALRTVGKDNG